MSETDGPPFKLIDHDPGSHLWVMGKTVRDKYKMPVMGEYMMEYAERIKVLEAENERLKAQLGFRRGRRQKQVEPTENV